MYNKAKESYMQGALGLNFISAENSMGFHNPTETARILTDSAAFANKAESLLRQALTGAGVAVPEKINLDLRKYMSYRGKNKRNFVPNQEFKDPFGTQDYFTPGEIKGL